MKNDIIELLITDITPEGYGVGRYENKVVFVADTAVGDRIKAVVIKELKSHSIAKLTDILTPSPDRITPDCVISKRCGGCALRHISYESEAKLKRSFVKNAFSRIGGIELTVGDTEIGNEFRYRNKVQYPFATDENGRIIFGYYSRRSHRIVKHTDCPLQDEIFIKIASFVADCANELHIPAYNEESGKGILRHLVMRKNRSGEILMCFVVARESKKLPILADLIASKFEPVIGIHYSLNEKRDNVIFGETSKKLSGADSITDTLCGKSFSISPRAFYQVNADMAERLYSYAKSLFPASDRGRIILDLYCGAGTIGLSVANDNDFLCGVEIIDSAIENAKANARANNRTHDNTLFICGDASVGVKKCREKFGNPEIIIVDPPRKGLDKAVIETVVNAKPEEIIYISCDPATLARDCAIFAENGYFTDFAKPFDLFPRTGHVETVCLLRRKTVSAI